LAQHRLSSTRTLLALTLSLLASAAGPQARGASVLMISVDGLKPEYVLDADAHGLKIPFLRGLMRDGSYARGVIGVWPTVTYPSHTTLLTGLTPAQHGIYNNLEFDPRHTYADSWYWYARQIRVPTLWHAAHAAGMSTASIGWPVSVGAADVDFLIPEYWRTFRPTADLDPSDADLMDALSRPEGMLGRMQARLGPYMSGNDPSPPGDEIKTRFALDILRTQKPKFMTIHLSSLDLEQHFHGPFSGEANRQLEVIDAELEQLFAAARGNDPRAIALVVSDHGFMPIIRQVNLMLPFLEANLIRGKGPWKAQPWGAGGMAAVLFNRPADAKLEAQVRALLHTLQSDPRNGIAAILERDAIRQHGAFPGAKFLVVMQPGYYVITDAISPLVSDIPGSRGSHGFSPEYPQMRASFFIAGEGIAHHRDLGLIDMRQIAPTVAQLLGVGLPTATRAALAVRQ
jgi:predicted AlkP superfamily pyrophosphatase or phosphodiesterase